MYKLSEYVEMAATEYLQETGKAELNAHWAAEFFQDNGVQDSYPQQDLIAFCTMVQKALTIKCERTGKQRCLHLDKAIRPISKSR
ncbi:conserved hypothetical protein [Candidatus Nitrotoga sp. HW29]|uniref:hypothetical protein n=1 Tax=Candidatus Nitrotoga sp. HW29 TaxID=2886963 RepID=UPI001EF36996|nr:hypothetical protein [Candidatus Nitrotoga sp. HW29]CAH1903395.1 conserved hypothetical protein [Candidatus Nitrotoga sp. HW29]